MAEGRGSGEVSTDRSAGIGVMDEEINTFVWSKLPKDVQHKVLGYLPIQDLCQMRCVCKEWRDVIHRRDFHSVYDTVNSSQNPSPAICYMESSYPMHLEWSTYDYTGKMWKKKNSFPSLPQNSLTPFDVRLHHSLYSVGGLLCLYSWKPGRASRGSRHHASTGVSSWIVWHPFRNRWRKLPPCKHKLSDRASFFVHVFVSDERAKTYKIVMAHDPKSHRYHFDDDDPDRRLVTEIYDSATGMWTDGAEYTLRRYQGYRTYKQVGLNKRGVLCNGVIYFLTGWVNSQRVLLSYDIKSDQWHEEIHSVSRAAIFEWDGRLMTIMSRVSGVDEYDVDIRTYFFGERDPATRSWEDTGIEIPWTKILGKFRTEEGFAIVASGNQLAVTGYTPDGSFKIAVYKRAENYWRLPPTGAFSDKLKRARVEGLVLHTPSLDWIP